MFLYKEDLLFLKQAEKLVSLQEIANQQKTPFYLYDLEALRDWYHFFMNRTQQRLQVFFAMKSNSNQGVLKAFQKEGAGADVVSLGEARLALNVGFSPNKIVFSGVGKSTEELEMSLEYNFFQINVESFEELKRLARICEQKNKTAKIGLRINPNVDFDSHPYIKTGLSGHKFGLQEESLKEILPFIQKNKRISLQGLSMHIGSQICDLDPLLKAIKYLRQLYETLKGKGFPLKVLDIGGGLGVSYENEHLREEKQRLDLFNKGLQQELSQFKDQVITEPGRFLVARFGILCSKVEYIKHSSQKKFLILNSGMNHFLRPSLYNAKHRVLPFKKRQGRDTYDVVGPICETGDTFYKECKLSPRKEGDWLAIADTGAYGFVMSNAYNLQIPVKEICFDKAQQL